MNDKQSKLGLINAALVSHSES